MRWGRLFVICLGLLGVGALGRWVGMAGAFFVPSARWAQAMAQTCREHAAYHDRMEEFHRNQARHARQQKQRDLQKAHERLAERHDAVQEALEDLAHDYERLARRLR